MPSYRCPPHAGLLAGILVLALGCQVVAAMAGWEGLSLAEEEWHFEGEGLDTEQIFARVDSLESALPSAAGAARAELQIRLAQLYLSTNLIKHRRHALALLEEAAEGRPDLYEATALWATVAERMRYTSAARSRLESRVDDSPHDPRPATQLGRFYFREARRRNLTEVFGRAAGSFERAVAIAPGFAEAWQGLATARLATREYGAALVAARRWRALESENGRARWIEAAALAGCDSLDAAQILFASLLSGASTTVRDRFEGESGVLGRHALETIAKQIMPRRVVHPLMRALDPEWTVVDRVDWAAVLADSSAHALAVSTYWKLNNARPTKDYNSNQLLFWRRLVEADVLFGEPGRGTAGWDTEMGDAWVRWGPPTSTFYDAGGASGILSDLSVAGVRLSPGDGIPQNTRCWIWTYQWPGTWFSLVFTDPTMNSRWRTTSATAEAIVGLTREQPMSFHDGIPDSTAFGLAMSSNVFPRSEREAVLETYLQIDREGAPFGTDTDTLAVVEWALFDEADRRVDYRREAVGEGSLLSRLATDSTRVVHGSQASPLLWTVGARVAPGRYRVAVEVSDVHGSGRASAAFDVDVREPGPPGFLELSDVQIASHFGAYDAGREVPLRFVKFGQVVVPAPSRRFSAAKEDVGIYFELRQPALDEKGRTSLDVAYEVFEDRQRIRAQVTDREFRRDRLERVDPLSAVFLEETTGVSREGLVIKGANLSLEGLGRGNFLVLVTVTDRISGQSASRAAWFRRSRL